MKRRANAAAAVLLAASAMASSGAEAQLRAAAGAVALDTLAARFQADMAIPDGPAFLLLPTEPSSVLRPGSVREFALMLSDFAGPEGFRLPDAVGLEVSPALVLIGHRLGLAEYRRRPWLYRLRASGAVQRADSTGGVTQLAFGVRATLLDGSDLRTNPEYVQQATEVAAEINEIVVGARLRAGPPPAPIVLTQEERRRIEELNEVIKERWADRRWNADVLEVAAGLRAASADSAGGDPEMAEYAVWATYGKGFGSWGQWLVAMMARTRRPEAGAGFAGSADAGTRFYAGRNAYRLFLEAQSELGEAGVPDWFVRAGGEARLLGNVWGAFWAGAQPREEAGGDRVRAGFTLRFGAPGAGPESG